MGLEYEKEIAECRLGKINVEMVYKDYGVYTITNYKIHVVKSLNELVL